MQAYVISLIYCAIYVEVATLKFTKLLCALAHVCSHTVFTCMCMIACQPKRCVCQSVGVIRLEMESDFVSINGSSSYVVYSSSSTRHVLVLFVGLLVLVLVLRG